MPQSIAHLTLVVRNYEEALEFYTQKLGFHLWRDYKTYQSRGVRFLEAPRQESYGTAAVFEDLYGNKWDLLQPTDHPTTGD